MEWVVIEHLEPCLNRWVLAEYSYVATLFPGRVVFSNVKSPKHAAKLSRLGVVWSQSVVEALRDRDDVVVLDPKAEHLLQPEDLERCSYVVIGGIMGSHPPEGRTWKFITSKLPRARARSLGPHQFTIAGAAYVLKLVSEGRRLEEIVVRVGLEYRRSLGRGIELTIHLPYAFPIDEKGEVVLPPNYLDIVAEYTTYYESRLLASDESVCDCSDC